MRHGVAALTVALVTGAGAAHAHAQTMLEELVQRHGIALPERGLEGAFDEGLTPTVAVTPGAFAAPLALLSSGSGKERIAAAYAFGLLAGRSARGVAPGDLAAAGQVLIQMMASDERRARTAGARVGGRIFAVPLDAPAASTTLPTGLVDTLFALLNRQDEIDQLAAMDALGLVRASVAAPSLAERYAFYRDANRRALAGGALEALARIGDPSSVAIVKAAAADRWSEGKDATALAVAFARERMLKDGSIAVLQQAVTDKSRRAQARGYLTELGVTVP